MIFFSVCLQEKLTTSYCHGVPIKPLTGDTIGTKIDKIAEQYPDREAYVFCQDNQRATFAEFKDEVRLIKFNCCIFGCCSDQFRENNCMAILSRPCLCHYPLTLGLRRKFNKKICHKNCVEDLEDREVIQENPSVVVHIYTSIH